MGFLEQVRENLSHARLNLMEISGAFGDMGTFLPLLVGMVVINGLPFVSSLFFSGLFHALTGLLYPIPMAVQPMKAIAAIALTEGLTADQIVAAGLLTGLTVFVLGITGGILWVHRIIPRPVVRGLQLGVGLALAQKGLSWALKAGFSGPIGMFLLLSLAAILLNLRYALPSALLIFLGGLALEVFQKPELLQGLSAGLSLPTFAFPHLQAFPRALGVALAQIPLTTLNSVISVVILARDLFPDLFPPGEERGPVTLRKVALTVGLMNLIGSFFGAMPMCHGSGGLAGQYRFGARTNGSILFLGGLKMAVALLLGLPLLRLVQNYPQSILGLLLVASGVELALAGRRVKSEGEFHIALFTAVGILGKGTLFGVLLGTGAHWFLEAVARLRKKGGKR